MPGLIDAHIHLSSGWRGPNDNGNRPVHVKWQLLNFLYAGVTQVYDIGNIPDVAGDTRDMVEAGAWMGPDIKIAGTYFETAEVGALGDATLLPELAQLVIFQDVKKQLLQKSNMTRREPL